LPSPRSSASLLHLFFLLPPLIPPLVVESSFPPSARSAPAVLRVACRAGQMVPEERRPPAAPAGTIDLPVSALPDFTDPQARACVEALDEAERLYQQRASDARRPDPATGRAAATGPGVQQFLVSGQGKAAGAAKTAVLGPPPALPLSRSLPLSSSLSLSLSLSMFLSHAVIHTRTREEIADCLSPVLDRHGWGQA